MCQDLTNAIDDYKIDRFRKNGITLMSDANEYEVQRLRRSQKRKNEKKKMMLFQQNQSGKTVFLLSAKQSI